MRSVRVPESVTGIAVVPGVIVTVGAALVGVGVGLAAAVGDGEGVAVAVGVGDASVTAMPSDSATASSIPPASAPQSASLYGPHAHPHLAAAEKLPVAGSNSSVLARGL